MGIKGQETTMQSAANMRGQMGLRSGPLAPTSAKLTTQYLVLDHMTNHYSKITKARPAIDNKPPSSMATSQKARDRKTRDHVKKTGTRPISGRPAQRPHTTTGYYQDDNIYDENLWGDVDSGDEESMLVQNIMRATLRGNEDLHNAQMPHGSHSQNAGFDQYARKPQQRPSSARSARSVGSCVSRTMIPTQTKKGTYDGDVLEKRSHVFTESKPFTPRTLKTDRKSRLGQYKYYNKVPPKDKQGKQMGQSSEPHMTQEKQPQQEASMTQSRPQPKPRQPRLDRTREGPVTMNSLMFETLHSRDFSKQGQDSNPDVPKLDISMDTDHMKWIKEQASKANVRQSTDTMKSTMREEDPYDTSVDFGKTGEMSLTYGTVGSSKTRATLGSSKKMSPEDEEGQYIKFMKDITNEILDRGIFTNRSVRQVFKIHMAKNKGILDELRMHQITDEIREQLNIPRYDIDDDTSLTMTKDSPPMTNGTDANLDKYMNKESYGRKQGEGHKQGQFQGHGLNQGQGDSKRGHNTADFETEPGMSMTLESMKSKASEPSADTYNFKSTEDDDLYSTIRSDMNNTANLTADTQALKTYQASIHEIDELEEGEIDTRDNNSRHGHSNGHHGNGIMEEGEIPQGSGPVVTHGRPHVTTGTGRQATNDVHENHTATNGIHGSQNQDRNHGNVNRITVSELKAEQTDDYDDDDEYDDDYEDDGDDEDDDDIQQTTEPTATYRTDDDDF